MSKMFYVRSRLRLLPNTPELGHTLAACAADSPFPLCHISVPYAFPSDGCLLWTRQYAAAFNQPLSFDTSSVTGMKQMFDVRFRLRLLPPLPSWATRTPHALLIRPFLCATSPCHTRFPECRMPPLDSAGSDCF